MRYKNIFSCLARKNTLLALATVRKIQPDLNTRPKFYIWCTHAFDRKKETAEIDSSI